MESKTDSPTATITAAAAALPLLLHHHHHPVPPIAAPVTGSLTSPRSNTHAASSSSLASLHADASVESLTARLSTTIQTRHHDAITSGLHSARSPGTAAAAKRM